MKSIILTIWLTIGLLNSSILFAGDEGSSPLPSPPLSAEQTLQILRETGEEFSKIQTLKEAKEISADDYRKRRSLLTQKMRELDLTIVDVAQFIPKDKAVEIAFTRAMNIARIAMLENTPNISYQNGWMVVTFFKKLPTVEGERPYTAQVLLHPLTGQLLIINAG